MMNDLDQKVMSSNMNFEDTIDVKVKFGNTSALLFFKN